MAKDPNTVAQLWATRLGNATQEISAGVAAVKEAPGIAAARQTQAYLAGIQRSVDKWARNVSGVSLQSWQRSMTEKGIPRVASGAQAAIPKMTQFMQQWLPFVDQVSQTVNSMPKGTLDQGIARATAQIRGNAQFQRQPYTV